MIRHLRTAVMAAALASPLAWTPPADAGVYSVYSCKTPNQAIAPTDGWSAVQQGGAYSSPSNGCPSGGGLYGYLNGDFAHNAGDRVGWVFSVPDDLELAGFDLYRRYTVTAASEANATPFAYTSWPGSGYTPDAHDYCVAGSGCREVGTSTNQAGASDVYRVDGLDSSVRQVYVLAGCGGSAQCVDRNSDTPASSATVKAFEARLRDTTAPAAAAVAGPLVSKPIHSGEESLSFNASDTGSGVYRTVVELRRETTSDWSPIETSIVDDNNGDCRDAVSSSDNPYEFVRRVPCKPQAGGSVSLDTRTIPNGAHELRVLLEDASGNRSTVLGPVAFKVSNPTSGASGNGTLGTPTNGAGASNEVRISIAKAVTRRGRHLRFGQRFKLVATFKNELGKPVAGAQVALLQRSKLPGARFVAARTPLKTGPKGKIRWTVPAGMSRRLRVAYKANLLNASYQSTTDIPLVVAAATTLRRNHRSYRNGQTIRFTGKVRSKPIPKGGVLIDLQAYKPGAGWVTFATRRSGKRGRWSIGYHLVSTTRTVRYKFRARVRQDTAYPYAAGKTKSMSVLVRP